MKLSFKKFSFTKILALAILVLGLIVVSVSIHYRTNLFPRAKSTESSQRAASSNYYLEKNIRGGLVMTTNSNYELHALLKHKGGNVVTNQKDFEYRWSNDFPNEFDLTMIPMAKCTNKIKLPCPNDHLVINAPSMGLQSATNIEISVVNKTTGKLIASTEFYLNLLQPEIYTTMDITHPDGGETFRIGEEVAIYWSPPSQPIDYYNLYYSYYEKGEEKGGYIGSATGGSGSHQWVIPRVLKNKKVRVLIEGRKDGIITVRTSSSNDFLVR